VKDPNTESIPACPKSLGVTIGIFIVGVKYYPGVAWLNFGVQKGSGAFDAVWPLTGKMGYYKAHMGTNIHAVKVRWSDTKKGHSSDHKTNQEDHINIRMRSHENEKTHIFMPYCIDKITNTSTTELNTTLPSCVGPP
jgi:hypothetical protein